jgi:hypothetical protein
MIGMFRSNMQTAIFVTALILIFVVSLALFFVYKETRDTRIHMNKNRHDITAIQNILGEAGMAVLGPIRYPSKSSPSPSPENIVENAPNLPKISQPPPPYPYADHAHPPEKKKVPESTNEPMDVIPEDDIELEVEEDITISPDQPPKGNSGPQETTKPLYPATNTKDLDIQKEAQDRDDHPNENPSQKTGSYDSSDDEDDDDDDDDDSDEM